MKEVHKNNFKKNFWKAVTLFCMLFAGITINILMSSFGANSLKEEKTIINEISLNERISFDEKDDAKEHNFQFENNDIQSKSSEIIAVYVCNVKPGMLKKNKEIWEYFVKRIGRNERGWKGNCYYNSDESIVTYIEIFKDIEAFEFHEEEHLKDPEARKKWEATAEVISAELYGPISNKSSELLNGMRINKKFSGNIEF